MQLENSGVSRINTLINEKDERKLPDKLPDSSSWPRISIVTPSYNQGQFIEETIRSVLLQGYPNLEYIIIDGGSTDNSVEIIKKYEEHLTYWVSEPDEGLYDAINKGFSRATGEIMAWSNSDDLYVPWTFRTVAEIFNKFEFVNWITGIPTSYNVLGSLVDGAGRYHIYSKKFIKKGFYGPIGPWIQQQSTFWRRELWEKAGGRMNASYDYAGDFELWKRFSNHDYLFTVTAVLGGFRHQPNQKTAQIGRYYDEISDSLSNKKVKKVKLMLYNTFIRCKLFYFKKIHDKKFKNFVFKENIPLIAYSFKDNDWVCHFNGVYK